MIFPSQITGLLRLTLKRFFPLAFLILILGEAIGNAGGLYHVFTPEIDGLRIPVARPTVISSRSHVTVSDYWLEYNFTQTFFNDNDVQVTGLYIFPLPDRVDNLQVKLEGSKGAHKILTPEKAFQLIKKIAVKTNSSALLEHTGKALLVIEQMSIAPKKQKTISLIYRTREHHEKNHLSIHVTLAGERHALGPVGELLITVRFKTSRVVRNLLSPTHEFSAYTETPYRKLAKVVVNNTIVKTDFALLATFSGLGLDLCVIPHYETGTSGAFLAFISPPEDENQESRKLREIVLIIDVSGSLDQNVLQNAKKTAGLILGRLRSEDRFNIIIVQTSARQLWPGVRKASKLNMKKALKAINNIEAKGATDLYNGLILASGQFNAPKTTRTSILITDGRATVGVVDPRTIIKGLVKANSNKARFFCIALGKTPDMALLDKIAQVTGGASVIINNEDKPEKVLERILNQISPPVLSGLSISIEGAEGAKVIPERIADLLPFETAIIVGKFKVNSPKDPVTVRLLASMDGNLVKMENTFHKRTTNSPKPYITRLWAMRRMGELLESLWFSGPDQRVRKDIIRMVQKYGLPAPESVKNLPAASIRPAVDEQLGVLVWRLKSSNTVYSEVAGGYKYAHGKVFRRSENKWVDLDFHPGARVEKIEFLSPEYFEIAENSKELARILSIDSDLVVMHKDRAFSIQSSETSGI